MTNSPEAKRLIDEHLLWLARRKRATPATLADRRRLLGLADRRLPQGLLHASDEEIAAYLATAGRSPWTPYTYDSGLRVFYAWAVRKNKLTLDPMEELAKPPTPEGRPRPTPAQYYPILMGAPEPIPTITILGQCEGLRRSEIAALYREEITEVSTYIRRGKGGRPATIPTHPAVWAHIQTLPPGPVVVLPSGRQVHALLATPRGKPMTPGVLGRIWREARARLGLPDDLVPHQNRHRFVTDLRRATGDITVAAKGARHRSVRTTQGYNLVDDHEVADAMRLIGQPEPAGTRLGPPLAA